MNHDTTIYEAAQKVANIGNSGFPFGTQPVQREIASDDDLIANRKHIESHLQPERSLGCNGGAFAVEYGYITAAEAAALRAFYINHDATINAVRDADKRTRARKNRFYNHSHSQTLEAFDALVDVVKSSSLHINENELTENDVYAAHVAWMAYGARKVDGVGDANELDLLMDDLPHLKRGLSVLRNFKLHITSRHAIGVQAHDIPAKAIVSVSMASGHIASAAQYVVVSLVPRSS